MLEDSKLEDQDPLHYGREISTEDPLWDNQMTAKQILHDGQQVPHSTHSSLLKTIEEAEEWNTHSSRTHTNKRIGSISPGALNQYSIVFTKLILSCCRQNPLGFGSSHEKRDQWIEAVEYQDMDLLIQLTLERFFEEAKPDLRDNPLARNFTQ